MKKEKELWYRYYSVIRNSEEIGVIKFYRDKKNIFHAESISVNVIIGLHFEDDNSSGLEIKVQDELFKHFGDDFKLIHANNNLY